MDKSRYSKHEDYGKAVSGPDARLNPAKKLPSPGTQANRLYRALTSEPSYYKDICQRGDFLRDPFLRDKLRELAKGGFIKRTLDDLGKELFSLLEDTQLFQNGVYESVLEEILQSQKKGKKENFLQPYKQVAIRMLKDNPPTANSPVTTYMSTTDNLNKVSYQAEIIGWFDKQELSPENLQQFNEHIKKCQPGEGDIWLEREYKGNTIQSKNLLHITGLKKITPFPIFELIKQSDGIPLKNRTQSGGWSEVYRIEPMDKEEFDKEFESELDNSSKLSPDERETHLPSPGHKPEKVITTSQSFKRSPHVIAEALVRAKKICGLCNCIAPFYKPNGDPYLEVHHWIPLSENGDDTIENAVALCPNCHKRAHHGADKEYIAKHRSLLITHEHSTSPEGL